MKLIIQLPCLNEEATLPNTIRALPRTIEGIDTIEYLVINDGSTDRTVEVARQSGVHHIISFTRNKGLAKAFEAGLEHCLKLGADLIVNTDADNQYNAGDICKLVTPIIRGEADMVIGDRQTNTINHFSWHKKKLQRVGTKLVRNLADLDINDAVSGFRAFSRETAMRINILTDFSYTVETLIQLGHNKSKVISIPIRTNGETRKSRLFKGLTSFVRSQLSTLVRVYSTYKSLRVFSTLGALVMLPGLVGFARFMYFVYINDYNGHIQSLIFSTAFIIIGFLIMMFGLLADMIASNRKLIEKLLMMQKEQTWSKN